MNKKATAGYIVVLRDGTWAPRSATRSTPTRNTTTPKGSW